MEPNTLQSTASSEVQAKAAELGWIPPDKFKGDPERFTDADVFIERGETVLPIVKKQLEMTRAEFAKFRVEAGATTTALKALLEKQQEADVRYAAEKQRAVDEAIRSTKAALAKANEAGDHEAAAELTGELVELDGDKKAAAADAAKAKEKPAPVSTEGSDKAEADVALVQEWIADGNEWFKTSPRKQALMQGIAMELRQSGNTQTGKAFMNACKAEMLSTLGEGTPAADKVEGGRNGDGTETRAGGKKTFNSLPADAKAQCLADGKTFVGPNKRFKTQAEYNARYAEIYFERE